MNNDPMHDDEFLAQFRKKPRPEFARNLYAKISQENDESMIQLSQPSKTFSYNGTRPHPRSRWDQRGALVAALVALALLSSLILWFNRPAPDVIPAVVGESISPENADQLTKLTTLGKGQIIAADWSPDGKLLALPGTLGVWIYSVDDLENPITLIPNETGYTISAQFTADSQHLIISDYVGLRLWDIASQTLTNLPLELGNYIGFDVSPDGRLAVTGDFEGNLRVYDVASGEIKTEFSLQYVSAPIMDVSFSPDGTRIAFTGNSMPVLMLHDPSGEWDHFEGEPVVFKPETGSEAGIWSLHFNRDGSLLAARVGTDIYLWDTATVEVSTVLHTIPPVEAQPTTEPLPPGANTYASGGGGGGGGGGGAKGGGGDLTFSPDGTQIVTLDQSVRLWNVETGEARTLMVAPSDVYLSGISFNPDWSQMVQVGSDGVMRIMDVDSGEELARIDALNIRNVMDIDFNADGTRLAAYSDDNRTHVWDISDLNNVPTPELLKDDQSEPAIYGFQRLNFDPKNPASLAALTSTGIVWWDVDTLESSPMWKNPESQDQPFAYSGFMTYSADGTMIASSSYSGTMLYVWDAATGDVLNTFSVSGDLTLHDAAFSPDGKQLAISIEPNPFNFPPPEGAEAEIHRVDIWDIDTSEVVLSLDNLPRTIVKLAYTLDGKFLATAGADDSVRLWDVASGEQARVIEEGNPVGGLALSPDGKLLVTAEFDQTEQRNVLRVWDMSSESDEPVATLDDPLGSSDVTFSRDGKLLAAGSSNGTVDVWSVQ
jgi:WD40 repeat protein